MPFFDTLLTNSFANGILSSPELMWCAAANDWDTSRPGCYLIPVVSHDDGGGITSGFTQQDVDRLIDVATYRPWMEASKKWLSTIQGNELIQVEEECRKVTMWDPHERFDLQSCSSQAIFFFNHYHPSRVQETSPLRTTGSLALCRESTKFSAYAKPLFSKAVIHPDSHYTLISCTRLHYRISNNTLRCIKNAKASIIVGVLSSATKEGRIRRNSIRSTWSHGSCTVLFVVAGCWEGVKEEYEKYGDLLWIDMTEVYHTFTSVLTFKTQTYLSALYEHIVSKTTLNQYLFKTDDDSYVALDKLHYILGQDRGQEMLDYWGNCPSYTMFPHREHRTPDEVKWHTPVEVYPETQYPTFCMGAGYALSRRFLDCAFGKRLASNIRFMPNEDVATGLLAERCQIEASNDNRVVIFYEPHSESKIAGSVVQHGVKNAESMHLMHEIAMRPHTG